MGGSRAGVTQPVTDGHEVDGRLQKMDGRAVPEAVNKANGADPARGLRRVGPVLERRSDKLTLTDESIHIRLLARGGLGLRTHIGEHLLGI